MSAARMVRVFDAIIRNDPDLFFKSADTEHLLFDHIPRTPANGYYTNAFGWYVEKHLTQLVLVVEDVQDARTLARQFCLDNYIHFGAVGDSINLCSAAQIVSLMNNPHLLVEWRPASDAPVGIKTLTEFDVRVLYNDINLWALATDATSFLTEDEHEAAFAAASDNLMPEEDEYACITA